MFGKNINIVGSNNNVGSNRAINHGTSTSTFTDGSSISRFSGPVRINGVLYAGNNVEIHNGDVYVDGTKSDQQPAGPSDRNITLNITIENASPTINVDNSATFNLVSCKNTRIHAGNSVDIKGDCHSVQAGNNVKIAGSCSGPVTAGNNIYHK